MKNEKCLKTTSKKALHRFAALAAVLLAVCLVFMMPAAADSVFSGGSGTENDPYKISTADNLKQLVTDVNGGNTYSEKYFQLTQDITLSGEWTPIGDMENMFSGTFDGNGKTIYGLSITSSQNMAVGLFGAVSGNVKNLHVFGDITITSSTIGGCGGIVGFFTSGTISSCSFVGDISITSNSDQAGATACGIAGTMMSGTISDCYSAGNITVTCDSGNANAYGIAYVQSGTVSNCYALNKEITATANGPDSSNAGKIANKGTLSDNHGWAGMEVNNDVVTDGTASNTNGQAIYAETFWNNLDTTLQTEAAYLEPKFSLTYNANGGSGTVSSTYTKYASGEPEIVKSGNDLTVKEGHEFAKWNTHADGAGTDYNPPDPFVITKNENLYAQWTPITYTVKFNENGGTGDMQNQDITYGSGTHLTANAFTKEGHSFTGWATSPDGAVVYTDGTDGSKLTTTANELVNLYAVWTPDIYTVKFDNNTGTGTMADQEFTYGVSQALSEMTFTAPDDKEFAGWALSANGAPKYSNKATVLNLPYDQNKQITLYANWTSASSTAPTTHTVTFKDGENVVSELLVSDGETVQAPELTKTGYTLSGWNKEDGTKWNFASETVTDDITLTANWTGNPYTVKFNANGGDGTMDDQTFTYGTPQALTANAFSKAEHSFEGWAETEGGEVKYTDGYSVSNLAESGTVNLYAVWKINQYTITFDTKGGSAVNPITQDYGTAVTTPVNPTKKGYTFNGWNPSIPGTMPAENIVLTAKWTGILYTVKYNENGGTGTMEDWTFYYGNSVPLRENTFTAPNGKVFTGWNTKADGSGTAYADKATVSAFAVPEIGTEITLYAQWKSSSSGGSHSTTKTTYTVTFNANGGAGEMFPQTFTSGKEKALNLNFFTKEGYTFAGWATSADGDVVYTDGETIKVSKSMTLYAVWESNEPVDPEQPGDEPGQPGDEPENPEKPTEPETPAPILAVLAGLGAAVVLRRK